MKFDPLYLPKNVEIVTKLAVNGKL